MSILLFIIFIKNFIFFFSYIVALRYTEYFLT